MPRNRRIPRGQASDSVRDKINFQRTILGRKGPNVDPIDTELTVDERGVLRLYVDGEGFRQISPPLARIEEDPIPEHVRVQWQVLEEELELAGIPREDWIYYRGF